MSGRFVLGAALVVAAYIAGRRESGAGRAAEHEAWDGAGEIAAARAETAAAAIAPAPPRPDVGRPEADGTPPRDEGRDGELATLAAILAARPAPVAEPAAPTADAGARPPVVEEIDPGWAAALPGWTHTPAVAGPPAWDEPAETDVEPAPPVPGGWADDGIAPVRWDEPEAAAGWALEDAAAPPAPAVATPVAAEPLGEPAAAPAAPAKEADVPPLAAGGEPDDGGAAAAAEAVSGGAAHAPVPAGAGHVLAAGVFTVSGFAVNAGDLAFGRATFPERLAVAPAAGDVSLHLEAVENVPDGGLVVMAESGFAPCREGVTLVAAAAGPGRFLVRGRYEVRAATRDPLQ